MISWKIKTRETKMEFPVSLNTLVEKLDTYDPEKEIFSVISYSVDPRWKENVEGYTVILDQILSSMRGRFGILLMLGKG